MTKRGSGERRMAGRRETDFRPRVVCGVSKWGITGTVGEVKRAMVKTSISELALVLSGTLAHKYHPLRLALANLTKRCRESWAISPTRMHEMD